MDAAENAYSAFLGTVESLFVPSPFCCHFFGAREVRGKGRVFK